MKKSVDVVIIGAGTSGLNAFSEVIKVTQNVVLINDGPYGTTCARIGCMPSKVLIEVANDFARRRHFSQSGILGGDGLGVDGRAVMTHVRALRDRFVGGVMGYVNEIGDKNVKGHARFVDENTIEVGSDIYHTKATVVATGSRPVLPAAWASFADRVVTTDALFELETLPQSIAIIGLGAIGAEIGQALARLGVHVVGIEKLSRVCGLSDPDLNTTAQAILSQDFPLWMNQEARLQRLPDGRVLVTTDAGSRAEVDLVLASLGRRPNLENLGLEALGIDFSKGLPRGEGSGFSPHSTRYGTRPIYFAGDVNGHRPILHEAGDDGLIAGYNAARLGSEEFRRRVPLRIAFTEPPVASVGASFSELSNTPFVIARRDFKTQAKAIAIGRNEGLLHIYAHSETGKILGAEMMIPQADLMAFALAQAIESQLTVRDLLSMPFYHPSLVEGVADALGMAAETMSGHLGFGGQDLPLKRI